MRKLQMKKIACMVMALTSLFTTRAQKSLPSPRSFNENSLGKSRESTGEPGKGGMTNKGAKETLFIISPGNKDDFDVKAQELLIECGLVAR